MSGKMKLRGSDYISPELEGKGVVQIPGNPLSSFHPFVLAHCTKDSRVKIAVSVRNI